MRKLERGAKRKVPQSMKISPATGRGVGRGGSKGGRDKGSIPRQLEGEHSKQTRPLLQC